MSYDSYNCLNNQNKVIKLFDVALFSSRQPAHQAELSFMTVRKTNTHANFIFHKLPEGRISKIKFKGWVVVKSFPSHTGPYMVHSQQSVHFFNLP